VGLRLRCAFFLPLRDWDRVPRIDLDGFEIEASGRNVARVSYATSLMKKGVLISTTEHLLSAFIGAGIDNAIVELDNLELPILDGSARPFIEMIQKAASGATESRVLISALCVEVECAKATSSLRLYPANTYLVSYSINFPHPRIAARRSASILTNGSYVEKSRPPAPSGSCTKPKPCGNKG